ncbi:MAG: N-acetylglucosamine-6-phosphate deacetylase [Propionibacteriaceae bacterium]|jgi:N-acetylglucosamine-6-phosphate deacetylase|nr:N-acetylglucosamine-6-phosphate deacetylase [Propionibacteriaceae bacterium]
MILRARAMLTPTGLVKNGWVRVEGDRIVDASSAGERPPDETVVGAGVHSVTEVNLAGEGVVDVDGVLSPGFVDVHSHGGGGTNFGDGVDQARTVLATHLAHGTTTMLASLVTGSIETLETQIRALSALVETGELAGVHLEGPWLSEHFKGAHEESLLVDPDLDDVTRLLDACTDVVRMVTIAPEKPGALDAIALMTSRGVVVAIGHTGADYDEALAGIAAGARGTTHLFNAMPPLLHRRPGPVLACWADPRMWVELVCDGVHVHPDLIAHVARTKPDKVVLITDAMAAAGFTDGDYLLGALPVEVRDGIALIAGTTTIAGSTLTLDKAVRTAVRAGVPLEVALRAATCNPADYLGLSHVGRIAKGLFADFVVLDDDCNVTRVMRHGQWVN